MQQRWKEDFNSSIVNKASAVEPRGIVAKAAEPPGVVAKAAEPTGVVAKAAEPPGVVVKAAEPPGVVAKAVGLTGVVVNTVVVLGFKQPVLVKLSKKCHFIKLDLKTNNTCFQSSKTFKHKNDFYSLAICLPNNPIEQPQLKDHKPFTSLNRNAVINALKINKQEKKGGNGDPNENGVLVDVKVSLKSQIRTDKSIVVPVMLIGLTGKTSSLLSKSGRIFIFHQSSLNKRFTKVMNHLFVAENDSCGTMVAHLVLGGSGTSCQTLFSNGDYIGKAELFNSYNPDHIQQCLESSKLQAGGHKGLSSCFSLATPSTQKNCFLTPKI